MSLDAVIINILTNAVEAEPDDYFPSLEEVVAEIKATPPNPGCIHPATASLADLLRDTPTDFVAISQLKQENWLV
jgi:hypothetical protein